MWKSIVKFLVADIALGMKVLLVNKAKPLIALLWFYECFNKAVQWCGFKGGNVIWSVPSMNIAPGRNIRNSMKVFPNADKRQCRQKLYEPRKRCWLKILLITSMCMSTCTLHHKLSYLHIGIWILVHCVSFFYI